ncbi:tRNA (5-methylaminomethyl-2-thiouridylate)-methyltransferase / FAD-dependent cmnm(5)s(2)U34 oxidoreductase [Candidatus Paraburkholderia calva]|nr:tRNA (5-methylaminomethyl-2-thiouridylate)-methyltransferase / FAD-dependent cmnm(5)s(2)U34 oxidoreductase [Candidatus Paraburkholderia calva]
MSAPTHASTLPDLFALHDLPARWRQRRIFTLADTHFGGARFLDAWRRWRADDARCDRLHVIAVGTLADLDAKPADDADPRAAQLVRAWPMRVPGVHRLAFDSGRVVLTLAIGNDDGGLSKLWARVDAFHLDAFALADTKRIAKTLARFADDDATVTANADETTLTSLSDALRASGFECDTHTRTLLRARFTPRWRVRRHEPPRANDAALRAQMRHAIVIGTGLASCAITARLASRGWRITLIDRHALPARDASGNPAGVFHPIVWRDDSVAARLTRVGFLSARDAWRGLEEAGHELHHSRAGLLQIADTPEDAEALAAAITQFDYPREYVIAASDDDATRIADMPVTRGGWFFPHGGAVSPAAICAAHSPMPASA